MNLRRCLACLLTITLLGGTTASAQTPAAAERPAPASTGAQAGQRPTIGVAFGGGSAKGFAHIGVLRWFDEHRIPIDVAAGTSMGGLIGGAFAIGLSPDEVQAFVGGIDWDLVFLADTPFSLKAWRRKEDARRFPSQIEFGLRGGLTAPSGLNSGRAVDQLIEGLVIGYSDLTNFDQLPTPFRLIATDTVKAEMVALGTGSLASAMRATMALPGVFPPVRIGDALFVDGGTLNNVPADIVRQMGANVVIAVDVGGGDEAMEAEERAPSMFGVMGAALDTMMRASTNRAIREADLLIAPRILPYGSLSWNASRELAQRGYEAAEANRTALLRYQVDEATYAAWKAQRASRRRTAMLTPTFVEIVGAEESRRRLIEETVDVLIGKPVDLAELDATLWKLSGSDRYETIHAAYVQRDGQVGLRVQLVPKPYGPPFLELGFELNNLSTTTFAADVRARVTMDGFLGGGSEFRLDLGAGSTRYVAAESFRPLWSTPIFIVPRAFWRREPAFFVRDGEVNAEYVLSRAGWGLDMGTLIGNKADIRFGFTQSDLDLSQRIGSPLSPERHGSESSFGLAVTIDTQTSPMVPVSGLYVRARLDRYLEIADIVPAFGETFDEVGDFSRGEVIASWFTPLRQKGRVFVAGGTGSTFDERPLSPYNFSLGGPFRLGALVPGALTGPKFLQVTTGYLHEFGRLPSLLGGPMYVGGWLESGSAFEKLDEAQWTNNVTTGVILESLIGPIFGAVSLDVDGGWRYYISIGRLFR